MIGARTKAILLGPRLWQEVDIFGKPSIIVVCKFSLDCKSSSVSVNIFKCDKSEACFTIVLANTVHKSVTYSILLLTRCTIIDKQQVYS